MEVFFSFFQRLSSRKAVEEPQPVEGPVPAVSLQHRSMRQKAQVQHPKPNTWPAEFSLTRAEPKLKWKLSKSKVSNWLQNPLHETRKNQHKHKIATNTFIATLPDFKQLLLLFYGLCFSNWTDCYMFLNRTYAFHLLLQVLSVSQDHYHTQETDAWERSMLAITFACLLIYSFFTSR